MNSKILISIIVIISATLGLYIGINQVSSQKEFENKKTQSTSNNYIFNSGDLKPSGDFIENSGDIVSGELENNSGENVSISSKETTIPMPSQFKAVYITGWGIGTKNIRESIISTMKENSYNAIVIDIKDEAGQLSYNSNVQIAKDIGASRNMIKDISAVINELHDNNIYVVGRIVTFKDPIYAGSVKTSVAYKKSDGTTWKDYSNNAWPNPYNENSWEYPIELAKEAATLGFDEIQFDYIRFPSSEGKVKQIAYGFNSDTQTKSETINAFLEKVMQELSTYNVTISADVFGITTKRDGDFENIGQDFAKIASIVDVICPMVYPSHYAYNEYKIAKPDLAPYEIVYNSLQDAYKRLENYASGDTTLNFAKVRPYLQDFTASWLGKGNYITYSTDEVAKQIQACYDLKIYDFTLWDPSNKYCYTAIKNVSINSISSGEN